MKIDEIYENVYYESNGAKVFVKNDTDEVNALAMYLLTCQANSIKNTFLNKNYKCELLKNFIIEEKEDTVSFREAAITEIGYNVYFFYF